MKKRECGSCQLCCKLLPIAETEKAAGVKCAHQRFRKGCSVYADRPISCRYWDCGWLSEPLLADARRPDIAGYVIDHTVDFVTVQYGEPERLERFKIIQIWCDPKRPDAHKDPVLRSYLEGLSEEWLSLVRYGGIEGIVLIPPSWSGEGWVEHPTISEGREHSISEYLSHFGSSGPLRSLHAAS